MQPKHARKGCMGLGTYAYTTRTVTVVFAHYPQYGGAGGGVEPGTLRTCGLLYGAKRAAKREPEGVPFDFVAPIHNTPAH